MKQQQVKVTPKRREPEEPRQEYGDPAIRRAKRAAERDKRRAER